MKNKIYILHGWSRENNEGKWKPFMEEMKKRESDCVFLKIPGVSARLDKVWELDDFVEWLKGEVGDERVILIGHSFGGQIASRFSAEYSDKVEKLILIDAAGMRDRALVPTVKRWVFLVLAKLGKPLAKIEILRKVLYKLARESDYKNAPPLLRRTMSKILDEEVIEDLSKIKINTFIVWGNKDKVTPVKFAQVFHDKIKGSELVWIEGARHSPQFTHTGEVVEKVSGFIRE